LRDYSGGIYNQTCAAFAAKNSVHGLRFALRLIRYSFANGEALGKSLVPLLVLLRVSSELGNVTVVSDYRFLFLGADFDVLLRHSHLYITGDNSRAFVMLFCPYSGLSTTYSYFLLVAVLDLLPPVRNKRLATTQCVWQRYIFVAGRLF
jgi:hypothetical protein